MQRLADIAEEEDQRVNLIGDEEGEDTEIDGDVVLVVDQDHNDNGKNDQQRQQQE